MFKRVLLFVIISLTVAAQLSGQKPYSWQGSIHAPWCDATIYSNIQFLHGNAHATGGSQWFQNICWIEQKVGYTFTTYYSGKIDIPTVGMSCTLNGQTYSREFEVKANYVPSPGWTIAAIRSEPGDLGYLNSTTVFGEGDDVIISHTGGIKTDGWYPHIRVGKYVEGGGTKDYKEVDFQFGSSNSIIIHASELSRVFNGNYTEFDIGFSIDWRSGSSNTSTWLGNTDQKAQVTVLKKLSASLAINNATCFKGNGSAIMIIESLPSLSLRSDLFYLYTIHNLVECNSSNCTGSKTYSYNGITYKRQGEGSTTSKQIPTSGSSITVDLGSKPAGVYQVEFYLQSRQGGVTRNFYPSEKIFQIKEPEAISVTVTGGYCTNGNTTYYLPPSGSVGNQMQIRASGRYVNGTPMPLQARRMIGGFNSPYYDVVPANGASFAYQWSDWMLSSFQLRIFNADDENCKVDTTIPLIHAPRLNIRVSNPVPPTCPSNSESNLASRTGEVQIEVSGGCGTLYRYSFDKETYQRFPVTSPAILHLTSQSVGTHTVYITDGPNIESVSYTIPRLDSIKYHYHLEEAKCSGQKAVLSMDSLGGFGNRPWLFFSDDSMSLANPPKQDSIPAGAMAHFVIRDERGCSISFDTTTMASPPAIQLSNLHIDPISHCTKDNGRLQFGLEGGTTSGLYTVAFNHKTTERVNAVDKHNLSAMGYDIHIEDDNRCPLDTNFAIGAYTRSIGLSALDSTRQYCDSVLNATLSAEATLNQYPSSNLNWRLFTEENDLVATAATQSDTVTFGGLAAGNYRVRVEDDSTCYDEAMVEIGLNPDQFTLHSLTSTNTMCAGISTGTLAVEVAHTSSPENVYELTGIGGRAVGYTKALADAATGYFDKLMDGSYHIRVRDAAGCVIHGNAVVNAYPNPVEFTSIAIDPKYCNEQPGGTVTLRTNHNRGYSIDSIWIHGLNGYGVQSDRATFHNLGSSSPTASWRIFAKGSQGCINDTLVSVPNIHNNPRARITRIDSLACADRTNGAIELGVRQVVTTSPYTFTINSSQQQRDNTARFIGLNGAARYAIHISDTMGCSYDTLLRVPVIAHPFHMVRDSVGLASCNRAANGTYFLSARGGKNAGQEYTFVLRGLEGGDRTISGRDIVFENLPTFIPLTYRAYDADGCSATGGPKQVRPRTDSLEFLNHGIRDASCPEKADGRADLQTRFGNAYWYGYEYALYRADNGDVVREFVDNAFPAFNALLAGSYRAEVEDADSCLASESFTIGAPDPVTVTTTPGYVARKGDATGWARAALDAGNDQYRVEWYTGTEVLAAQLIQSETTDSLTELNNLTAGDYLLRVSDTAGCVFWEDKWLEERIHIPEPESALHISLEQAKDVSCNGLSDGSIEVAVQGGWGNAYQIGLEKNHLDAVAQINALPKGAYRVFVQDTAGVFDSLTVFIDQPEVLEASVADVQHISCFGYRDGSIQLHIIGGNYPYEVSDNEHTWVPGNLLNALAAGTHTIYVRDSLNCRTSSLAALTQPEGMSISDTTITDTQCGVAEGVIEVTPVGGTPEYRFSWTNLEGEPVEGNALIENLLSGVYFLQLTDNNGCAQYFRFNVSDITDLATQNWNIQAVNCWGDANGRASMEVVRGFPPYTITWPDSTQGTGVENLEAGVYLVSVEDDEGCKLFETFTIPSPDSVSVGASTLENPWCHGVDDGSIRVDAEGGTPGYHYVWNTGRSQNEIRNLQAGTYSLTVTDAHECAKTYTYQLQDQTQVHPLLRDSVNLCYGNVFPLDPGEYASYRWTASGVQLSEERVLQAGEANMYVVEVEDRDGCVGRDSAVIRLSETEFEVQAIMASEIFRDDTLAVFETSHTVPDSLEIYCSEGLVILEQGTHYAYVAPSDTGTHTITVIAHRNDCIDIQVKEVHVLPGSSAEGAEKYLPSSLVQSFTLFPNPSDGNFTVGVHLSREANATLRLLSQSGVGVLNSRELQGNSHYETEYRLNGLQPDVYVLFLEAEGEVQSIKFILL